MCTCHEGDKNRCFYIGKIFHYNFIHSHKKEKNLPVNIVQHDDEGIKKIIKMKRK